MNTQETRALIMKLTALEDDASRIYRELHRAEEYTIEEAAAIEKLEYLRVEIVNIRALMIRQAQRLQEVKR